MRRIFVTWRTHIGHVTISVLLSCIIIVCFHRSCCHRHHHKNSCWAVYDDVSHCHSACLRVCTNTFCFICNLPLNWLFDVWTERYVFLWFLAARTVVGQWKTNSYSAYLGAELSLVDFKHSELLFCVNCCNVFMPDWIIVRYLQSKWPYINVNASNMKRFEMLCAVPRISQLNWFFIHWQHTALYKCVNIDGSCDPSFLYLEFGRVLINSVLLLLLLLLLLIVTVFCRNMGCGSVRAGFRNARAKLLPTSLYNKGAST